MFIPPWPKQHSLNSAPRRSNPRAVSRERKKCQEQFRYKYQLGGSLGTWFRDFRRYRIALAANTRSHANSDETKLLKTLIPTSSFCASLRLCRLLTYHLTPGMLTKPLPTLRPDGLTAPDPQPSVSTILPRGSLLVALIFDSLLIKRYALL